MLLFRDWICQTNMSTNKSWWNVVFPPFGFKQESMRICQVLTKKTLDLIRWSRPYCAQKEFRYYYICLGFLMLKYQMTFFFLVLLHYIYTAAFYIQAQSTGLQDRLIQNLKRFSINLCNDRVLFNLKVLWYAQETICVKLL